MDVCNSNTTRSRTLHSGTTILRANIMKSKLIQCPRCRKAFAPQDRLTEKMHTDRTKLGSSIETCTDLNNLAESKIVQNIQAVRSSFYEQLHLLEQANDYDESVRAQIWDAVPKQCVTISIILKEISDVKSRLEDAYDRYVLRQREIGTKTKKHEIHGIDAETKEQSSEDELYELLEVVDIEDVATDTVDEAIRPVHTIPAPNNAEVAKTDASKLKSTQDQCICLECGAVFKNRSSLKPHLDRVHRKVKSKSCKVCARRFTCSGDLTRHLRTHSGERPFLCTHCPMTFISSGDMNKHMRRHNRDVVPIPRKFVCNICNASFDLSNSLKRHSMKHVIEVALEFTCEFCHKSFYRKDQFKDHVRRHLGLNVFTCNVCDLKFRDRYTRLQHERAHSLGPFTCNSCKQTVETKCELIQHLKKFHNYMFKSNI